MHINWKSRVTLPTYEDAELNAALRDRIRAATDDDLLSAFLHYAEGHIALKAYVKFDRLFDCLQREQAHAQKLEEDPDSPLVYAYRRANYKLQNELRGLADETETARNAIGSVWHSLRQATTRDDLNHRYRQDADPVESGLEQIGPLKRTLTPSQERLDSILAEHRNEMHRLALREAELHAFTASDDSISLDQFDRMSPLEFEQAIAALAQRDGYVLARRNGGARDLGADVIATTPDGRKIVFQCKHRQRGGRPLGSPVIQTLNGTARPLHNADIVIAVTNSSFTTPAHDLARKQDIHLLHGEPLRRWATWGIPLLTVLGAEQQPGQAAAA
ncbi:MULTISPECIES: restriction endonuclease [Streptomyces]|uniref:restriction endonuclease n=1 Tax=Streptomyces TaxID=1883 RepID=UPI00345B9EBA